MHPVVPVMSQGLFPKTMALYLDDDELGEWVAETSVENCVDLDGERLVGIYVLDRVVTVTARVEIEDA